MLDPIADMLTRIRNAQLAGHSSVSMHASKMKFVLASILEHEGFVGRVEKKTEESGHETLCVTLKYTQVSPTKKVPAIQELTRVSKQGCRIYVKKSEIKKVKNGYGIAIVSTSQGVMTGTEAFRRGLGGEYICRVW
ncbi:MAG: 30S ribosomal protein S8 [Candidatus Moranbacteria bacterium]|nr:30S ribosomal protein S8 [Candidatus Moranbacteria bacterium]OIQ01564.1 MAG: 30S ribosomal protein S8 [Candidatus Moranbacteria bacterium CG2_30_41_165]PIP25772.1 MAG: 30S ribosomal protein S8 [Candidatus Moranbacteria bacterium CG23_combo_of_CG06-09_8_20_14_all_41_28]PIV86625.1 MAG: 30S ribosomal protein S8 [Candidatus Moranbacteria bacterium CG17_big_fil_post_rev_8_21_14_2_50_41_107]PIW94428.1 MAG: 30S ribosomal protein S8 [Candidatus Moranbacteria bacterium CG_4_8_14_3_um_filter_41_13]PI